MSVLRKNTLLVSIKPHSTLQKYFSGVDLKADLFCYADVIDYIRSMHPAFTKYIHNQSVNGLQETFTLLDKNLRELTQDELLIRRPHKDDIIYIVPTILGGGGKRGSLALIAAAALMVFLPTIAPALASSLGGITLAGTAGTATAVTALSVTQTLGINLALMGVTMLLAPKTRTADASRDNNAFGSLVNTTASGTPVALHYGLVRVAGQLITGFVKTVEKADGDELTVDTVTGS